MRKALNILSPGKVILLSSLVFFFTLSQSHAMDVTLQWDANIEPDLDGYKIYYDTGSSGEPYDGTDADPGHSPITLPVGDLPDPGNPEYSLTGLNDNETYFFVVTAFDTEGLESDYSNEVNALGVTSITSPGAGGDDGGGCFIAAATDHCQPAATWLIMQILWSIH